jgi:macrolide transport system ATP-binding/permease protein
MMWGRGEQRLDDELRFDYEQRVENHRRAGMSEPEARRAARLEFGGIEQIKEECRDQQRFRLLRELLQDVHYGLRMMRRSPGFTAVALLTLGLGVGANTAIFTLMDAVLMKSLPVRDPGGLILFGHAHGEGDGSVASGSYDLYSLDLYHHLASAKILTELCALQSTDNWISVFRQGWSVALPVSGKFVSGNYFQVLGVAAAHGRTIVPQDDSADAPPAAVISYRLWEQKFNKDARIIGSTIDLDRIPVSIVGVAPPEFTGETPEPDPPSVWMPISALRQLSPDHELLDAPDTHWLYLMGRLSPGISIAQGQARLTTALQNWLTSREGTTVSPARQKEIAESYVELTPGGSGVPHMQRDYGKMLTLLLGISSLVLLITCANVATLLLARGAARDVEQSVRLALGASPTPLLRQWLTEGLMLGLAGGMLGLLVAFGATKVLIALVFGRIYIPLQTTPDFRVLFFAFALSCGTGIVFGLIPAIRQRNGLAQSIRRGSAAVRGTTFSRRRFSASSALIASQVALSLAVLVCAGLLVHSLRNVSGQRFGFTPEHVLIVRIDPSLAQYEYSALSPLYRQIHSRLNALPGVKSASLSYISPFNHCCWASSIAVEGHTPDPHNDHSLLNRRDISEPLGQEFSVAAALTNMTIPLPAASRL